MKSAVNSTDLPMTQAARRALLDLDSVGAADDLRFLETWETRPTLTLGAMLRAAQIRRANPTLAAEIDAELRQRR